MNLTNRTQNNIGITTKFVIKKVLYILLLLAIVGIYFNVVGTNAEFDGPTFGLISHWNFDEVKGDIVLLYGTSLLCPYKYCEPTDLYRMSSNGNGVCEGNNEFFFGNFEKRLEPSRRDHKTMKLTLKQVNLDTPEPSVTFEVREYVR